MKRSFRKLKLVLFILLFCSTLFSQTSSVKPVSPNASPEAVALLNYIYSISGKYLLTGQHNYPNAKDKNTLFVANYVGKTPVIFSTDWGFAKDGDKDSHFARPEIVREAIRQHKSGSIITICWHAVPPTANEPVTFQPLSDAGLNAPLASVQGRLTEQQYHDILTPGTKLYKHWCEQVDTIAKYLKMLQQAHVPVIWRPYHEMNGSWFWWGGRIGKYSTMDLYKQIYDRLIRVHKLNNLIWLWSVDRPNTENMQFANYFPGPKFVDILGLDVYGNDFKQDYYDKIKALSGGKPITLAEVGNPPSAEIMKQQPDWVYYVVWSGMVRNTTLKNYLSLAENNHVLYKDDKKYVESMINYRKSCNLSVLEWVAPKPADYTGTYIFNEETSITGNNGPSELPYEISILQHRNSIDIQKTYLVEYLDTRVEKQKLLIDGPEISTQNQNSQLIRTAKYITGTDTLELNSTTSITKNGNPISRSDIQKWFLTNKGKTLVILQNLNTNGNEQKMKLNFDKAIKCE
jgi:mannan endo-1,4-beta-mannosidase